MDESLLVVRDLHDDILASIFKFLDLANILSCRLVCHRWASIAGRQVLGVRLGLPSLNLSSALFRKAFPNIFKLVLNFTSRHKRDVKHEALVSELAAVHGAFLASIRRLSITCPEELTPAALVKLLAIPSQLLSLSLTSEAMLISSTPNAQQAPQLQAAFASLSHLRSLSINGYAIPATILETLSSLTSFHTTQLLMMGKPSIPVVKDKPHLQELSLHIENTDMDDDDAAPSIHASVLDLATLTSLCHLSVITKHCLKLSPGVMQSLSHLTTLTSLHLDCIPDNGSHTRHLTSLAALTDLQQLLLPSCTFGDQQWALVCRLPLLWKVQLEALHLLHPPAAAAEQLLELHLDELWLPDDMEQQEEGQLQGQQEQGQQEGQQQEGQEEGEQEQQGQQGEQQGQHQHQHQQQQQRLRLRLRLRQPYLQVLHTFAFYLGGGREGDLWEAAGAEVEVLVAVDWEDVGRVVVTVVAVVQVGVLLGVVAMAVEGLGAEDCKGMPWNNVRQTVEIR